MGNGQRGHEASFSPPENEGTATVAVVVVAPFRTNFLEPNRGGHRPTSDGVNIRLEDHQSDRGGDMKRTIALFAALAITGAACGSDSDESDTLVSRSASRPAASR